MSINQRRHCPQTRTRHISFDNSCFPERMAGLNPSLAAWHKMKQGQHPLEFCRRNSNNRESLEGTNRPLRRLPQPHTQLSALLRRKSSGSTAIPKSIKNCGGSIAPYAL